MQKHFGKGSGWIIHSVDIHTINVSKHNPLVSSSSIKLEKKNTPSRKRFD